MKVMRKLWMMLVLPVAFVATSCEDLEVENLNAATIADVLANPADYPGLMDGAMLTWWQAIQLSQPNMPVSVAAQTLSSSWGNWGMQDLGTIPRQPLNNTLTYNNRGNWTGPWSGLNNSLAQVNEVGRVMNDEFGGRAVLETGEDITDQVVANMKVVQGMSLGWLGLLFDQSFIADENTPVEELASLPLSPYRDVINAAVAKLEEAAAIFAANPNITLSGMSGYNMTGQQAVQFLNSYAAKFLVYSARNGAETQSQTNWAKALQLMNNGLTFDFSPAGDGNFWWSRILIQGQTPLWSRVSQRLINMAEGGTGGPAWDTNPADRDSQTATAVYPWPEGAATQPRIENPRDARINTDYRYVGNNGFQAARGYYFFGAYAYNRYAYYLEAFLGPMPHLTKAESDLIRAEALIRTGGSKAQAADIINVTRVGRGGLAPVNGGMSDAALIEAISYERLMEFPWDASVNGYFFRRITTHQKHQLHQGTFEHFPLPAAELEVLGIPVYTFGGS